MQLWELGELGALGSKGARHMGPEFYASLLQGLKASLIELGTFAMVMFYNLPEKQ